MHHHVVAGFLTTKHATSNPYRRHFLLFIDRLNVPRVTVQRTEVPLEMASRKGRREQKGFGKTTEAIVASFFRSRMQLTRSEFIFLHLTSFTKYPNPRCYELIHFTSVFFSLHNFYSPRTSLEKSCSGTSSFCRGARAGANKVVFEYEKQCLEENPDECVDLGKAAAQGNLHTISSLSIRISHVTNDDFLLTMQRHRI